MKQIKTKTKNKTFRSLQRKRELDARYRPKEVREKIRKNNPKRPRNEAEWKHDPNHKKAKDRYEKFIKN